MPSPEIPHRHAIDDLDDSDESHQLDLEHSPAVDETVLSRAFNGEPRLNLADAHETADEEAKKRSLTGSDRVDFIADFHRENHKQTKNRALDEIKSAVLPAPDEKLSEDQRRYSAELEKTLDTTFSGESIDRSRLERELGAVTEIESIEDEGQRDAARSAYIEQMAQHLPARPKDAEAIYEALAEQPAVYQAILQQKQVLLILEHDPDRYEDFIAVSETGDAAAMQSFVMSLNNPSLQTDLQTLQTEEHAVAEFIEHRNEERLAASRETFGDITREFDTLKRTEQLQLGRIARQATPIFLTLADRASLIAGSDSLTGTFLNRPVRIQEGRVFLGDAEIRTFDAAGIRRAAAVDTARRNQCQVFDELNDEKAAAVLEPLLQLNQIESLPMATDVARLSSLLDALGLKSDVADGWMVLREFQLIKDDGTADTPGIRRLVRQLRALPSSIDASSEILGPATFRLILNFWDHEGAQPRQSTILSLTEVTALPD